MSVPTLLATVAAVAITSAVGGLARRPAISSTCYTGLRKPPCQPRRPVFPTVVAYPLWCGCATLLTGQIGLLNRSNG